MQINRISTGEKTNYSPNFKAIVDIHASKAILGEEAVKELKEIGKNIGNNDTKIDMYFGFGKDNPYVYNFRHKTELNVKENHSTEKITFETNEDITTPTIKPLDYGKNLLKRISDFIKINTIEL